MATMSSLDHVPVDQRYFEDYTDGAVFECGPIVVEESEIIAFAKRYDPQYFHTDPEAATRSVYGGLIASGWHTAALTMRQLVDNYLSSVASLGSPGIDELRWIRPVRPADALSARVTVLEAKRSRSKPDRGVVRSLIEVSNQHGELVMSLKATNLLLCRDPAGASATSTSSSGEHS
jgi:acyl dehydratase